MCDEPEQEFSDRLTVRVEALRQALQSLYVYSATGEQPKPTGAEVVARAEEFAAFLSK